MGIISRKVSAGLRREVGDVTIDRVVEIDQSRFGLSEFFPEVALDLWSEHAAGLDGVARIDLPSGTLAFALQSFVVRTRRHVVVVDTCVGSEKARARPEWNMRSGADYLSRLATLDVRPEDVDYVVCTHLHADHVGWNTRLRDRRWTVTFPNAGYVIRASEWRYWSARHASSPIAHIGDSVVPVIDSGQALLITDDIDLGDGVRVEHAPGHTPGHQIVSVVSGSSVAVITGDTLHTPVQCVRPDWSPRADHDVALARDTRTRLLGEWSRTGALVCATHFPAPSFGRVMRSGGAYRFHFDG